MNAFLFKRLFQQQIVLKTDGWAKIDVIKLPTKFFAETQKVLDYLQRFFPLRIHT